MELMQRQDESYGDMLLRVKREEQSASTRLDYGKPRPDLLPVDALLAVSAVMATGVEKHGARTWEAGRPWGGEYGAVLRHLWAWWGGQENDPDTGLPHLAHAAARVLMLLAMTKRRVGADERGSGGG